MTRPYSMSDAHLRKAGALWLGVQAIANDPNNPGRDDAKQILRHLTELGYFDTEDGQPEAMVGADLYQAFCQVGEHRTSQTSGTRHAKSAETTAADDLRTWLRDIHRRVAAISRANKQPELQSLQLLGELSDDDNLRASAKDMLKFLARPEVLARIGRYRLGTRDADKGQALLARWEDAARFRTTAQTTRKVVTGGHIDARKDFATWLNKWWELLAPDLQDQPRLLRMAGMSVPKKRGRRAGGSSDAAVVRTSPEVVSDGAEVVSGSPD